MRAGFSRCPLLCLLLLPLLLLPFEALALTPPSSSSLLFFLPTSPSPLPLNAIPNARFTSAFSCSPCHFQRSVRSPCLRTKRPSAAWQRRLSMKATELFEKDCIEILLPEHLLVEHEPKSKGLVAVIDADSLFVQLLCVREEGSKELYADSRVAPFSIQEKDIVRVLDVYPSQRPIPSLGGGIGYGAEAVDCWELQEEIGDDVAVPFEDTGMGFHQKGWA